MSSNSLSEYGMQSREEVLHGIKDKHALMVGFVFVVCAIITVIALKSLPSDPTAGFGTTGNAVAVILGGAALFSAFCVGIIAHYRKVAAKHEEEKRPELAEALFNQLANPANLSPAYKDLIHRANDETWKDVIRRSSDLEAEQREGIFTNLVEIDKQRFLKIQLETLDVEEQSAFVKKYYTLQGLSVMSNPTYQAALLALISTAESHEDLQSLETLIKIEPVRFLDNYFELIENKKLDETLCEKLLVHLEIALRDSDVKSTIQKAFMENGDLMFKYFSIINRNWSQLSTIASPLLEMGGALIRPVSFLDTYFEFIETEKVNNINKINKELDKILLGHLKRTLRDTDVKIAIHKAFMENRDLMFKYFSVINRNWSQLSTIAKPLLLIAFSAGMSQAKLLEHLGADLNPNLRQMISVIK